MPKMPTWQSLNQSQDGKKREVMWSHQMPMWHNGCTHRHGKKQIAKTEKTKLARKGAYGDTKCQEPPNTSCFTHLDEQTASVDETLMEALFTVERGKQNSRQKQSDRI
jgi:hypothetical protein